jgi:hypothetical protein
MGSSPPRPKNHLQLDGRSNREEKERLRDLDNNVPWAQGLFCGQRQSDQLDILLLLLQQMLANGHMQC